MIARTMKTEMDTLMKALDEMQRQAKSEQENRETTLLRIKATTGELGVEYKFFEQIHLKNRKQTLSVTIPPSQRASMAVRKSGGQAAERGDFPTNVTSIGRNSREFLQVEGDRSRTYSANNRKSADNMRSNSVGVADPWFEIFEEINDQSRNLKAFMHRIKGMTADERTHKVKEELLEDWSQLEQLFEQIESILDEYQRDTTKHKGVNLR